MNKIKLLLACMALLLIAPHAKADKGMWLLNELKKENIQRMKELGFQMDPEKLFSDDAPGLANAVVIFGRGCTGITVSNSGLIFTNHHCGYGSIQSQSSVEHDYLRDGFVANQRNQELPIEGLTVKYLREIIDITAEVEEAAKGIDNEIERMRAIGRFAEKRANDYSQDKHVEASVYPFYENNNFYLVVYDVFTDVRMVFAPPTSMGKFGGDTDNWMWPRHTNDFSVFRVYADANNRPADYSPTNKPYTPKFFAHVSMQGVKENDFAMTIGFPGSTDRYLSSWGVENLMQNENEPRILVRGIKQEIWLKHMNADQATRIQYASKYAGSSNYWKNSIGMNRGLKRLNVIEDKRKTEKEFAEWVAKDPARQAKYGFVLDSLQTAAEKMGDYRRNLMILAEALNGIELRPMAVLPDRELKNFNAEQMYKDFNPVVAKATLPAMLRVVKENVDPQFLPDIFAKIDSRFGGNYDSYAQHVYDNSVIVNRDRMVNALEKYEGFKKAHANDPGVELVQSFTSAINKVSNKTRTYASMNLKGRRLFFAGLREMWPDRLLPSDANFTMRMSYGSVSGYKPYDAAWYDYYTTQQGVLEKQDPKSHEFAVQPEILDMMRNKEFGPYSSKTDGNLHLCFLSDNDITGGNSGSPVFDKNGNLIGLAFDGNWEAMSGDIEFEPNLQRTISVDIRYVLWAIDKWGKADNLIKELKLVK